MVICLLCLKKGKNQIKLYSKKGQELKISTIIAKHFWIQPNAEKNSKESICLACWTTVKDFHEFYQTIAEAHNYLEAENVQWIPFPQPKKEPIGLLPDLGTDEIKLELDALDSLPGTEVIEIPYEPNVTRTSVEKKEKQNDNNTEPSIKPIKKEEETPTLCLNDDDSESEIPLSKFLQSDLKVDDDDKPLSEPDTFDNNDFMPSKESSDESDEATENKEKEPSKSIVFAEVTQRKKKKKYDKKNEKKKGEKVIRMEKYDEIIAKMFDKFPCPECELYVRNFSDLIKHFKEASHTSCKPSVTCCERRFFQRPTLAEHVMVHMNPEHFKCEQCGHLSRDKIQFKEHQRKHDGNKSGKNLQCPICDRQLSCKPMLEKHILVKHTSRSEFKFDCPECPKKFATKACVRKHVKDTHHGGRSAMCDHCGKTCQTKYILRKHIAHEHLNIPKPEPIKAQCEVCLNWFRDIYSVRIHMKTAHDNSDKQHKCEICGYISVNARSLQRHIDYIHNLERTHQCSLCEKSFRRAHELKEHTATHTGKELFNCTLCPMAFYSKANYYKHKCKEHGHVPQPIRRIFDLNKKPKKEKEKKVEIQNEEEGTDPTKKKRRRRKKKNAPPEETNVQDPTTSTAVAPDPTVIEISEDVSNLQNISVKQEPTFLPQNYSTFEGINLQNFSTTTTTVENIPAHFLGI